MRGCTLWAFILFPPQIESAAPPLKLVNTLAVAFQPLCRIEAWRLSAGIESVLNAGRGYVIDESLGPYHILSRLGGGAMGEVYLAEDTRLHRRVAIKSLLSDPGLKDQRETLLREARAAATLSHPSIASVFDVIEANGRMHMVMEFVPGETLSSCLRDGPLLPLRALGLAHQIADALACAHQHGVLHCDLKPGNIVVTPDGTAKILDFGLSRLAGTGAPISATAESVHSGPRLRGTPPYMAPELLAGATPNERSDVYSLGVTMYEMVTGRRPYDAPDILGLVRAIVTTAPVPPSAIAAGIPRGFENVVSRAMEREATDRFESASAVRDELDRVLRREASATTRTLSPTPARVGRPGRSRHALAAVALALMAAIGGLLWILGRAPAGPAATAASVVAVVAPELRDPESEAFTRGFADMLTGDLHALPGLVVASNTEAPRDGAGAAETGRRIGASHVFVPSVIRAGGSLQLALVLRQVDRDEPLWSDQHSADSASLLVTQKRLIGSAASALVQQGLLQRTPSPPPRPDERMTTNLEAYAEYSQGRVFESRRDVAGNLERAIALYERAVAREPGFAQAHAAIGRVSLALYTRSRSKNWLDRAQKETLEALRLAPESPDARYAVAVLYSETSQDRTAIDELKRLLERYPEHDDAHRLMGRLLAKAGDLPGALGHLETARRLRPGYWDHHRALGLAYFDAGRYQDAIAAFHRLTELQPDSAWGFQTLGTAQHASGDRVSALENYRKAIAIAPSARSYSNIGTLLYEEGRFEDAVQAYRQAIALRPKEAMTHRNLGDALLRLNRTDQAAAAYRTSAALVRDELEVSPNDASGLALRAYCLARLGQLQDALALSARATALEPANNAVLYERGVIFALAKRPCDALEWLEKAIEKGYGVALIAGDHDLRALSGHPRFDTLVGSSGRKGIWAAEVCSAAKEGQ
jgi:serine/threonine-protein kinase